MTSVTVVSLTAIWSWPKAKSHRLTTTSQSSKTARAQLPSRLCITPMPMCCRTLITRSIRKSGKSLSSLFWRLICLRFWIIRRNSYSQVWRWTQKTSGCPSPIKFRLWSCSCNVQLNHFLRGVGKFNASEQHCCKKNFLNKETRSSWRDIRSAFSAIERKALPAKYIWVLSKSFASRCSTLWTPFCSIRISSKLKFSISLRKIWKVGRKWRACHQKI